jgi:UDP-N-acetyl-2-amino-2-deoxyglucuronate dehydrogenase
MSNWMDSKPLGFVIVGSGMIAGVHAQAINAVEGARLVGVVSRSAERGAEFASRHGAEVVTATVEEMVARSDVDVVCVTTPSGAHLEPTLAAIAAGKHLVVEKPLEINVARIDTMLAAATAAGVQIMPIFQNRFSAGAIAVKQAVEAGRFGRMTLASCYVKWWRAETYYTGSPWKGTRQMDGGGATMNQAIHGVDLLQWLAGQPEQVMAMKTRRVHLGIEVEDTATAVVQFAGGALGTIEASTASWPGWALRIELCGENGAVRMEDGVITAWQFKDEQPEDEAMRQGEASQLGSGSSNPSGISTVGHELQIRDMVASIREGRAPKIAGREGRHAVALIEALYASADSGQRVAVG